MAGLVGYDRRMAELLQPRMKDKEQSFKSQFEGTISARFSDDDHRSTLDRLKAAVLTALDDADPAFLFSFHAAEPDWSLFALESVQNLSGPLGALKAALLAGSIQLSPKI
jgi:hypothetical protein